MKIMKNFDVRKLVLLALLTTIVFVLQLLASFFPVYPFRLNLVIIPIVIGAAMIGPLAGCWLGVVFAFVVLVSSPDIAAFMVYSPFATILVLLLRGALSGLLAGLVYNAMAVINKILAVMVAALSCVIINTSLFVVGIYVFFLPVLEMIGITGAEDIASFVFLGLIGVNFFIELATSFVLCPAIVRLIQYMNVEKTDLKKT